MKETPICFLAQLIVVEISVILTFETLPWDYLIFRAWVTNCYCYLLTLLMNLQLLMKETANYLQLAFSIVFLVKVWISTLFLANSFFFEGNKIYTLGSDTSFFFQCSLLLLGFRGRLLNFFFFFWDDFILFYFLY